MIPIAGAARLVEQHEADQDTASEADKEDRDHMPAVGLILPGLGSMGGKSRVGLIATLCLWQDWRVMFRTLRRGVTSGIIGMPRVESLSGQCRGLLPAGGSRDSMPDLARGLCSRRHGAAGVPSRNPSRYFLALSKYSSDLADQSRTFAEKSRKLSSSFVKVFAGLIGCALGVVGNPAQALSVSASHSSSSPRGCQSLLCFG